MSENNNDQVKICTGDCMTCSVQQRIYCSSQISHTMYGMMSQLQDEMRAMSAKIEAMQTPQDEILLNPTAPIPECVSDMHNDGGADNTPS